MNLAPSVDISEAIRNFQQNNSFVVRYSNTIRRRGTIHTLKSTIQDHIYDIEGNPATYKESLQFNGRNIPVHISNGTLHHAYNKNTPPAIPCYIPFWWPSSGCIILASSTYAHCDIVRMSKELVGQRSIWRRPKYLRLCFADSYWSWFIVEAATIHMAENCLVWVQLKIVQACRDNSKVVPNMWTNASDFSGWRSPAQVPNPLLHNYL